MATTIKCEYCEDSGLDPHQVFGEKCPQCGGFTIMVGELTGTALRRFEEAFGLKFGKGMTVLHVWVSPEGTRFRANDGSWGPALGTVLYRER